MSAEAIFMTTGRPVSAVISLAARTAAAAESHSTSRVTGMP